MSLDEDKKMMIIIINKMRVKEFLTGLSTQKQRELDKR